MRKLLTIILLSTAVTTAQAQTTNTAITEHDAAVKAKDAEIKTNIIDQAEQDANGQAPDWKALTQAITQKYDAMTADRTVTKAKIYFYYYKSWPTFCDALVHYTDNWELASDYVLLNKNAKMILNISIDPTQLKEAQHWAKMAMDGDVNNADYKNTCQLITDKLAEK